MLFARVEHTRIDVLTTFLSTFKNVLSYLFTIVYTFFKYLQLNFMWFRCNDDCDRLTRAAHYVLFFRTTYDWRTTDVDFDIMPAWASVIRCHETAPNKRLFRRLTFSPLRQNTDRHIWCPHEASLHISCHMTGHRVAQTIRSIFVRLTLRDIN